VTGRDELLRQVERRALIFTVAAMAVAFVVPGGGAGSAAGVAGGALLSGVSYWAIKRGVTGIADAVIAGGVRPRTRRGFVVFVLRYALLAGIAYVMIARLRLPPLALLVGASAIPLAAATALLTRVR
jgi:hypothetical protein